MKSFTLVEILIYLAIVSIVLLVGTTFIWQVIYGGERTSQYEDLREASRFVLEKISYEVKKANDITTPTRGNFNNCGWLTGWTYRKKITITGQSGAGTNYQTKLLVGATSGGNFHVEGHSAIFPSENNSGDLRFTDNDGSTLLDFWVESVSGTVATIWVEVADSLESNVDIYCYYGNASATNVSNGTNTFLFFDDFNGSSFNSNKWTDWNPWNHGSITVSDSILKASATTAGSNYWRGRGLRTLNPLTINIGQWKAVRYKWKWNQTGSSCTSEIGWGKNGSPLWKEANAYDYGLSAYRETPAWYLQKVINGAYTNIGSSAVGWPGGQPANYEYGEYRFQNNGGTSNKHQWYRSTDSSSWSLLIDVTNNDNLGTAYDVYIFGGNYYSTVQSDTNVDWILVRKYASPEPAYSPPAGGEETHSQQEDHCLTITQPNLVTIKFYRREEVGVTKIYQKTGANEVSLTPNSVNVTSLTIKNLSPNKGPGVIQIEMTLAHKNNQKITFTTSLSVSLRDNQ